MEGSDSCVLFAGNIFGIGDCTSVPTSRTAAACAAESAILVQNLLAIMRGENPTAHVSGMELKLWVFNVRLCSMMATPPAPSSPAMGRQS